MNAGTPMIAGNSSIPIVAQSGGGDYGNSMIAGNSSVPIVAQSGGKEDIIELEEPPMIGGAPLSSSEQETFDSYKLDSDIVEKVLKTDDEKRAFMKSMNKCGQESGASIIMDSDCEIARTVIKEILNKKLSQFIEEDDSLKQEEKDAYTEKKVIPQAYSSKKVCIDFEDVSKLSVEESTPKKELGEKSKGFLGKFFDKKSVSETEKSEEPKGTLETITTPVSGPLQPSFLSRATKYVKEVFGDSIEKVIEKNEADYKNIKQGIKENLQTYDESTKTLKAVDDTVFDTFLTTQVLEYNKAKFLDDTNRYYPTFESYVAKVKSQYDIKSKDKSYVNEISKMFEEIMLMYFTIFAKQFHTFVKTIKLPNILKSKVTEEEYKKYEEVVNKYSVEYTNIYTDKEPLINMMDDINSSIKELFDDKTKSESSKLISILSDGKGVTPLKASQRIEQIKKLYDIVVDINEIMKHNTSNVKFMIDEKETSIDAIKNSLDNIYNTYEPRMKSSEISPARKNQNITKIFEEEMLPYYKATVDFAKNVLLSIAKDDENKKTEINKIFNSSIIQNMNDYTKQMKYFENIINFVSSGTSINPFTPTFPSATPVVTAPPDVTSTQQSATPVVTATPDVTSTQQSATPVVTAPPDVTSTQQSATPVVTAPPDNTSGQQPVAPATTANPPPPESANPPPPKSANPFSSSSRALSMQPVQALTGKPQPVRKTSGGTRKHRKVIQSKKQKPKQNASRKRNAHKRTKTHKRKHRTL